MAPRLQGRLASEASFLAFTLAWGPINRRPAPSTGQRRDGSHYLAARVGLRQGRRQVCQQNHHDSHRPLQSFGPPTSRTPQITSTRAPWPRRRRHPPKRLLRMPNVREMGHMSIQERRRVDDPSDVRYRVPGQCHQGVDVRQGAAARKRTRAAFEHRYRRAAIRPPGRGPAHTQD